MLKRSGGLDQATESRNNYSVFREVTEEWRNQDDARDMKGFVPLDEVRKSGFKLAPGALRERLRSLIRRLSWGLYERDEAVRLCVLCALAGESVFLLGPPGVAKSLIARRLKFLFRPEAKAFEYLMNRFSTPDEIFGPVSIAALKADRLERITISYLPAAKVVFLDEIWKAGPSIQNALLTAINEKIFRNGGIDQKIPMRVLVSASNELPAEGEGLEALWDRFLVRLEVVNIEKKENRHQLIRDSPEMERLGILEKEPFSDGEIQELDSQIERVVIPDAVLAVIDEIVVRIKARRPTQHELTEPRERPEVYVSDRRWKKIARLLRTSALCNGRAAVNETDCYLISYCIWDNQGQIGEVRSMVLEAIEKVLGLYSTDVLNFRRDWEALKSKAAALPSVKYTPPTPYEGHYKIDLSRNASLLRDADGYSFHRIPKDSYESLTREFKEIQLTGSDGTSKTAMVRAKRGKTPAQIILEKKANSPSLKAFRSTEFLLTSANRNQEGTSAVADVTGEKAQAFIAEFKQYRNKLVARYNVSSPTTADSDAAPHLFVEFSADIEERLVEARNKAIDALGEILQEIDQFAKEKVVE